jgi:large subunit ribosomal protein L10
MPTPRKEEIVKELGEILSRARIAILTDYRGLKVDEITDLRRRLGEVGAEYRVVKNSLTRLAAQQAGKEGLNQIMDGPTAIAYSYDDVTAPAKAVTEFIRATRSQLTVQGAIMDDKVLSVADVTELASLPSREVMLSRVMGAMQSPIAGLVGVLNAVPASLARVIQARKGQLEGVS